MTTSYGDTGLSPSTNYRYYVKALDSANNISGSSNSVTVKTLPQKFTGILVGQVTSATTGNPIVGAVVKLKEGKGKDKVVAMATTNSSGFYALTLDTGDYSVEVSAKGYGGLTQSTYINASLTKTLDFSLSLKGKGRNE